MNSIDIDIYLSKSDSKPNDEDLLELKELQNANNIDESELEREVRYFKIRDLKLNILYDKKSIKIDPTEYTFRKFHKYVRSLYEIKDDVIPINNTRLTRWYKNYNFLAESYTNWDTTKCDFDEDRLIKTVKFPRKGLSLMLEIAKTDNERNNWKCFNPNHIMIKLVIITKQNMAKMADKGFIGFPYYDETDGLNVNNFGQKKLQTVCVVDKTSSIDDAKKVILAQLKKANVIPDEWGNDPTINLISFGSNFFFGCYFW